MPLNYGLFSGLQREVSACSSCFYGDRQLLQLVGWSNLSGVLCFNHFFQYTSSYDWLWQMCLWCDRYHCEGLDINENLIKIWIWIFSEMAWMNLQSRYCHGATPCCHSSCRHLYCHMFAWFLFRWIFLFLTEKTTFLLTCILGLQLSNTEHVWCACINFHSQIYYWVQTEQILCN